MCETLFRGKRVDNGEWVCGDLFQDRDLGQMMIGYFDYYTDGYSLHRDYCQYEVIPETVGQYIGRTDKNGRKIFEGDILDNGREKGRVVYEEQTCAFCVRYESSVFYFVDNKHKMFEVVGNIYNK